MPGKYYKYGTLTEATEERNLTNKIGCITHKDVYSQHFQQNLTDF